MDSSLLNQIVFSTRFVIKEDSPIVYVSHDLEDEWQFFGTEKDIKTEDGAILFMSEILEMDSTIKDLLDLPLGGKAYRKSLNDKWIRK